MGPYKGPKRVRVSVGEVMLGVRDGNDMSKGPQAKECRQPLEAARGKETRVSSKAAGRSSALMPP